MKSWQEWLAARRAASRMKAEEVPLHEASPDWAIINGVDGDENDVYRPHHVGRPDGKFFSVIAILITMAGREVKRWYQVILKEAAKIGEEGVVVLVTDGHGRMLVQAKAEPGNDTDGCVLLAPSLQASRANLEQAHGGTKPPRAELVTEEVLARAVIIRADGARFWHKRNLYVVVAVNTDSLTLTENERWFNPVELSEALVLGDINEHLAHAWLVKMAVPAVFPVRAA